MQIYTDEHYGFLEVIAAKNEVGEFLPGEFGDLLADCGLTRTEAGLDVDFFPEQDEAQAGDHAREGDGAVVRPVTGPTPGIPRQRCT